MYVPHMITFVSRIPRMYVPHMITFVSRIPRMYVPHMITFVSRAKSNDICNAAAEQGHVVSYCEYTDGKEFSKRVEFGQSLAKQELNGRCVKCWECKDSGMQCERTATG